MNIIRRTRRLSLYWAILALSIVCLAAPQASEEEANAGFLLFVSDRANPSNLGICPNCEDIYVMSPDGSNATRLTFGGGAASNPTAYNSGGPDWSHRLELIAFHSNRVGRIPQIYLMDPDGTDQRLLVDLPGGAAFPSFFHNGNKVCFHSQARPRDIYTVNIHGSGLTNVTRPGQLPGEPGLAGDNIRCDWSPKGNLIAFTSNRSGDDEIYVVNPDGSDVVRLTTVTGSDVNPAWSPTGDRIAFESNRDGTPEIYVMDADGSNPIRLTNFAAEPTPSNILVTKPTWSPNGDRIAFHRRVAAVEGQRGHIEVYTMNADGTDATRITFSPTPGFSGFPSWGKSLVQP